MWGADFILFCIAAGSVLVRLGWLAAGIEGRARQRRRRVDVVAEAIRVVERYEAQLRRQASRGDGP